MSHDHPREKHRPHQQGGSAAWLMRKVVGSEHQPAGAHGSGAW
jgi:hypothetical protein